MILRLGMIVLLSVVATAVTAQQVQENRARVMSEMGRALRVVVTELRRGKVDVGKLELNIEILAGNAPLVGPLFGDNVIPLGSEASPEIWLAPEAFAEVVSALEGAATELSMASDKAELKRAVRAVSVTCSGCHQRFRVSKN